MGIKNLPLRLHEAGKIKIGMAGEKRTSRGGREYAMPKKLEHFLVVTTERVPSGQFKTDEAVMAAVGPKPMKLPVRLPFDSVDENFDTCYAVYAGGKCLCRGDGERAIRKEAKQEENAIRLTGNTKEVDCGEKCPFYRYRKQSPAQQYPGARSGCKPYGVMVAVMECAAAVGGFYKFRTTSLNTILSITSSLKFIQHITGGLLAGIPLQLTYNKKQATRPDGQKTTIQVVNIEFAGTVAELHAKAVAVAQVRSMSQTKLVDLRKSYKLITMKDTPEDEADVNAEFHPDSMAVEVIEEIENAQPAEYRVLDSEEGADHEQATSADIPADAFDKREPLPERQTQVREILGESVNTDTGEIVDAEFDPGDSDALSAGEESLLSQAPPPEPERTVQTDLTF